MSNFSKSTPQLQETKPRSPSLLLGIILEKKWSWLRHTLMVAVVFVNFYPSLEMGPSLLKVLPNLDKLYGLIRINSAIIILVYLTIIYLNLLYLIPKLLLTRKYLLYLFITTSIGVVYFFFSIYLGNLLYADYSAYFGLEKITLKRFISFITDYYILIGAISSYRIFKKWLDELRQKDQLVNEQLRQEIVHLKNQVNPHFLFNTLNNIVSLIRSDTEKATAVVHGLSDILRYQIYESAKEKIPLTRDIEMIEQLYVLEKLRRDSFEYAIDVVGEVRGVLVPPLLFINFVENAFKHSATSNEPSYCYVTYTIGDGQLNFICKNSKPLLLGKMEAGGIGLKNINRRLELLYKDRFSLRVANQPSFYEVHLTVPLDL